MNKITSTSFDNAKLLDLIPLDVGYNLAISTENGNTDLNNITSLNFTLVNDEATTLIKPTTVKVHQGEYRVACMDGRVSADPARPLATMTGGVLTVSPCSALIAYR